MMGCSVLLTVDLMNADSSKRREFEKEMKKRQWKMHGETTTWSAVFEDGVSEIDAKKTTKSDVIEAANASSIETWSAVCASSTAKPYSF